MRVKVNKSTEVWKPVPNMLGITVSNMGGIKKYGKDVNKHKTDKGYIRVCCAGKTYKLHRLIMEVFRPAENPSALVVDHINGDRTDNRLLNLRWCTQIGNESNPNTKKKRIGNMPRYEVFLISPNNKIIKTWNTQRAAAKELGLKWWVINDMVHHRYPGKKYIGDNRIEIAK